MTLPFTDFRRDVRTLNRQFDRRRQDRLFEKDNGVVLYALDNDVITAITAPWQIEHRSYLRYFLAADREAQESLAYILAEYFLKGSPDSRRSPFLVLTPADTELEDVWNHVYLKARRENNSLNAAMDDVKEVLRQRNAAVALSNKNEVVGFVRQLLEILTKRRGAIAELQRINRVQDAGTILPDYRVSLNGSTLLPQPGDSDRRQIAAIRKLWVERLNQVRPPTGRPIPVSIAKTDRTEYWTNNDFDAAVMARIEWINQEFDKEAAQRTPPFKPHKRLCLVTSDGNIESVARRMKLAKGNIADLYVRNPACFLCDREFFKLAGVATPDFLANTPFDPIRKATHDGPVPVADELRGSSLRDWLGVVFPKLGAPARMEARADPYIVDEVRTAVLEWASYLKSAAVDAELRETDEKFQKRLDEILADLNLGERLDDLRARVLRIGNEAMTRFGVAGVLAGFWSLSAHERWPDHTIPAVKFERFPVATRIIQSLVAASNLEQAQQAVRRDSIELILKQEDPSGYTVFVVFALAFAFASEWKSAFTVARAAFSLASNRDDEVVRPSTIKGDEAAYLCAVCCRLSANRVENLDECEAWLTEAEVRQKKEPLRSSLRNMPDLATYQDPRFRAERLNLHVARLNFARFLQVRRDPRGPADLRDQLFDFWTPERLSKAHLQLLSELRTEQHEHILRYKHILRSTRQQLATNFLQLQLMAMLDKDAGALMSDKIAPVIEILREQHERHLPHAEDQRDDLQLPSHVNFIFLCASAVFLPAAARLDIPEKRQKLVDRLHRIGTRLSALRTMPYDVPQLKVLLKLVQDSLPP